LVIVHLIDIDPTLSKRIFYETSIRPFIFINLRNQFAFGRNCGVLSPMVHLKCSSTDAVFDSARFDDFVDGTQKANHRKDVILQQICASDRLKWCVFFVLINKLHWFIN